MQLQVLTVLARSGLAASLKPAILGGQIRESVAKAEGILSERAGGTSDELSEVAQLCGDLMLSLDRAEEADDTYRLAVKLAGSGGLRGAVRIVSCRSTGFLCLHQHRFGTAAACFARIVEDEAATDAQKIEALCALAMVQIGLGQKDRAIELLDDAGRRGSAHSRAELTTLVCLLRLELMTHSEIRAHDLLRDHVFWRSQTNTRARTEPALQPLAAIDICIAAQGRDEFVAARLRHLRDLILASYGDSRATAALASHIARLRSAGLVVLERMARIDTALVAISHWQADIARAVIEPLQGRDDDLGGRARWEMELIYCRAKLSTLGGRVDEAMRHYQRYALESMQCVRAEALHAERRSPSSGSQPSAIKDDVEMRLPAKYRRAYRYMQEHLESAELSVREIADNMGVTERALQSAFRNHLGMTPGEVIQRCRVERIRADLLREDVSGCSIIETAARWGIRNRSTLITSYRKYFRETPTETLARRGASAPGTKA